MMRSSLLAALGALAILWSSSGGAAAGAAHGPLTQAPDTPPEMLSASDFLRQAGFTVNDAEGAFLDADQIANLTFLASLFQVVSLAGPEGLPEGDTRTGVVTELQRLIALDPAAVGAAPSSLQRLRELSIEQRRAIRQAAQNWLDGIQANDPSWRERGIESFGAAQQSLEAWQRELLTRYPPPVQTEP